MLAAGHFACAVCLVLVGRRRWMTPKTQSLATVCVLVGTFVPDGIDKSVRAIGWTNWSRSVAHSALFWLLLIALWALVSGKWRVLLGWGIVGGLGHLVADGVAEVVHGVFDTGVLASAWLAWPLMYADRIQVELSGPLVAWPHGVWLADLMAVLLAGVGLGAVLLRRRGAHVEGPTHG